MYRSKKHVGWHPGFHQSLAKQFPSSPVGQCQSLELNEAATGSQCSKWRSGMGNFR